MSRHNISNDVIEYAGILAKLELDEGEKEKAKLEVAKMLDYFDKLDELELADVQPMTHIHPMENVFREDVVTNGDGRTDTLKNAPETAEAGFKVPKTIA